MSENFPNLEEKTRHPDPKSPKKNKEAKSKKNHSKIHYNYTVKS